MQKINSFGTGRKILVLTFLRAGDWTLDEKLKPKNIQSDTIVSEVIIYEDTSVDSQLQAHNKLELMSIPKNSNATNNKFELSRK